MAAADPFPGARAAGGGVPITPTTGPGRWSRGLRARHPVFRSDLAALSPLMPTLILSWVPVAAARTTIARLVARVAMGAADSFCDIMLAVGCVGGEKGGT